MATAVESELIVHQQPQQSSNSIVQFMEVAKVFAVSDLVPTSYRGKPANCLIALEMANRIGVSPIAVMQGLYVVNGRPSWSGQYIIAAVNSCGRFAPMQFEMSGEGSAKQCIAWSTTKDGTRIESPAVTMAMAMAEGWVQKAGSKWKTMPDLMLRYRAAAFFGRLHCPEILFGMMSEEESEDIPAPKTQRTTKAAVTETPAIPQPTDNGHATGEQVSELMWLKQGIPVSNDDWSKALAKRNVDHASKLTAEQADEMLVKLRAKVTPSPESKAAFDAQKEGRKKAATPETLAPTPTSVATDVPFEMSTADPAESDPSNATANGKATKDQVLEMNRYRDLLGISAAQWSGIISKKNVASESDLSEPDAAAFIANLEKKLQSRETSAGLKAWGEKVAPDAATAGVSEKN